MFQRIGSFVGDKIGAVQGKLASDRHWIRLPGRRVRTIRKARMKAAGVGAKWGKVAGWAAAAARWTTGLFF